MSRSPKSNARKQLEARVVVEPAGNLFRVFYYCPQTCRTIDAGKPVPQQEVADLVRRLKRQVEAAGHYCVVVQR